MSKIKIAIAGVGNCASSLVQGIHYYREKNPREEIGLMHHEIGGYKPGDIEVVAAFDIDKRKVGKDLSEAIFAPPNCTTVFYPDMKPTGVLREPTKEDVVRTLKESGAEILLNYMPVGSEEAAQFYADCALASGVAFVNNIPVFIASSPFWARRFKEKNVPLIGDDIKSQLGATITHRILTDLFKKRGVKLERTYQLNTGGNTDFLNMLNRHRLSSKKKSKTEAVQSVAARRLENENIHIGPSDYVAWQKDNKVCFLRMEGKLFGDVPMNLELRLSVEDSPNSAGVAIDAIRCAKLALERGQGGVLEAPSAYFCKHPPRQFTDDEAYHLVDQFISEESDHVRKVFDYSGWQGEQAGAKGVK
ncbi:MAG: inositol-3-phosphate synthase [Deltaproteobacteria bacterium]|nr:inositol-3-phosphate synthase [Deltaproteobacteria bacterium]